MKAILEFNLPEEKDEFELASNCYKYAIIIEEIENFLRIKYKHDHNYKSADEAIEDIIKTFYEIKNDNLTINN